MYDGDILTRGMSELGQTSTCRLFSNYRFTNNKMMGGWVYG